MIKCYIKCGKFELWNTFSFKLSSLWGQLSEQVKDYFKQRETAVFDFFLQLLSSLDIIRFTLLGDTKKIQRKQWKRAEKIDEYMLCREKDRERTRDNEEQSGYRSWKERQKYLISFSCQFLILNNLLKQPAVSAINTAAHCRQWENVCVCVVFILILLCRISIVWTWTVFNKCWETSLKYLNIYILSQ